MGKRRYETSDDSRNNAGIALLTMGEGWHNNHHRFAASARQGFFWWEVDVTYYLLWVMTRAGLIWDLRAPTRPLLDEGRIADGGGTTSNGARSRRRVERSMTDDVAAKVTTARGILRAARDNLDEAVAALPDGEADNAMATPALMALLLRVVEARRRLDGLELVLAQIRVS